MFKPEEHRGLLAGLDEATTSKLVLWAARGRCSGAKTERGLLRDEIEFRGESMFVATFAHEVQGERVYSRAMSKDWSDAVRNGLGVALVNEQFGMDEGVTLASSLEQWLAWQEQVRVR